MKNRPNELWPNILEDVCRQREYIYEEKVKKAKESLKLIAVGFLREFLEHAKKNQGVTDSDMAKMHGITESLYEDLFFILCKHAESLTED